MHDLSLNRCSKLFNQREHYMFRVATVQKRRNGKDIPLVCRDIFVSLSRIYHQYVGVYLCQCGEHALTCSKYMGCALAVGVCTLITVQHTLVILVRTKYLHGIQAYNQLEMPLDKSYRLKGPNERCIEIILTFCTILHSMISKFDCDPLSRHACFGWCCQEYTSFQIALMQLQLVTTKCVAAPLSPAHLPFPPLQSSDGNDHKCFYKLCNI